MTSGPEHYAMAEIELTRVTDPRLAAITHAVLALVAATVEADTAVADAKRAVRREAWAAVGAIEEVDPHR